MAAFLGGPLAAAYLFSKNYQAFSKAEFAKRAIIIGSIVTIIVFGSIPLTPPEIEEKIPTFLFPIIFLGISRVLADKYKKDDIKNHIAEGGQFYSNWRTAGISLIFAILTFIAAMIAFIIFDLFAAPA